MADRLVGVEVEFAGISLDTAVHTVSDAVEGRIEPVSNHEYLIHELRHDAPYHIEVDFELLKELSRAEAAHSEPIRKTTVSMLELAAAILTPIELVTPPLKVGELEDLARVVRALESAGAVGTQESLAYAFGTHFNPEVVDIGPRTVLATLRAFMCLHDWLRMRDEMNSTRRFSAFAQGYGREYELLVLGAAYSPTMQRLMDDYLAYNATRNRALDLLPLFAYVDGYKVRAAVDDARVKPRPTFHYRLPNSQLGDPRWTILKPWNDWLVVERLAAAPAELTAFCAARIAFLKRNVFARDERQWIAECDQRLQGL